VAAASPIRLHAPPIFPLASTSSPSFQSIQSPSFSSSSSSTSSSSQALTFDPRCGTTQQPISRSPIAFSGGAEYAYTIPLWGLWVGGIAVDATGSGLNASGTQTSTKVVSGTPISETFATNQRQAFTTTYRARIGFVAFQNTLIFFTAGGATGKVSGNFSYTAVQPSGGPGAVATGAASWNEWRTGYSLGGGVSFAYPMVLGSRLTVEYLYTNLGTVDQTIPVVSGPNASAAFVSMKTENSTVRAKLSWGL
jgi:opacity protein-like surface antigen